MTGSLVVMHTDLYNFPFSLCRTLPIQMYMEKGMDTAAVQRFHSVLLHDGFVTVADLQGRGGEPAPPPPLLGDGLTPSLAVMLANC